MEKSVDAAASRGSLPSGRSGCSGGKGSGRTPKNDGSEKTTEKTTPKNVSANNGTPRDPVSSNISVITSKHATLKPGGLTRKGSVRKRGAFASLPVGQSMGGRRLEGGKVRKWEGGGAKVLHTYRHTYIQTDIQTL